MSSELSIFTSLYRWARGQDENFCTEGLIHLLRLTLLESPSVAMKLIAFLTAGRIGNRGEKPQLVSIQGQVVSDGKRPDIEIGYGTLTVWIEVKVDSPVGFNQLSDYKSIMFKTCNEGLVNLLWRGGNRLIEPNAPHHYLLWTDLAEQLRCSLSYLQTETTRVLFKDYLSFLKMRSLSMSAVSSTIVQSLEEVESLILLIKAASESSTAYWLNAHYLGCPIFVNEEKIGWVGFNFKDPQWLFFSTDGHAPNLRLDLGSAQLLAERGIGEMVGKHWTMSVDLAAAADLFACDAGSQIAWLREKLLVPAMQQAAALFGLAS